MRSLTIRFPYDISTIISLISHLKPTHTYTQPAKLNLNDKQTSEHTMNCMSRDYFLLMCHLIILMSLGLILMLLNFQFCYHVGVCVRVRRDACICICAICMFAKCEMLKGRLTDRPNCGNRQNIYNIYVYIYIWIWTWVDSNLTQKGYGLNEISFLPIYTCRCFERIV